MALAPSIRARRTTVRVRWETGSRGVRRDIVRPPPWLPLALPPAPLPPAALPPVPATGVRGEAGVWGRLPFDPARAVPDEWTESGWAAVVAEAVAPAEAVSAAARPGLAGAEVAAGVALDRAEAASRGGGGLTARATSAIAATVPVAGAGAGAPVTGASALVTGAGELVTGASAVVTGA